MIVLPFRAAHIDALGDFGGQAWMSPHFDALDARALEGLGPAFSGGVGGRIVGCAGLITCHAGRAIAWALLSSEARRHVAAVHRAVKRFLDEQSIARIEAHVDCDFPAARRWVEALGFQLELERMRHFLPDGRDAAMWVRLRDGVSASDCGGGECGGRRAVGHWADAGGQGCGVGG
jgi:RimJ/RimL family protein N-acetyltransferase